MVLEQKLFTGNRWFFCQCPPQQCTFKGARWWNTSVSVKQHTFASLKLNHKSKAKYANVTSEMPLLVLCLYFLLAHPQITGSTTCRRLLSQFKPQEQGLKSHDQRGADTRWDLRLWVCAQRHCSVSPFDLSPRLLLTTLTNYVPVHLLENI